MKSKLLIVACLVIVLSMALILPLSIVNADYSDIQNNPNAIVNFNQLIASSYLTPFSNTNGVISGSVDANTSYNVASLGYFTNNHKYFLKFSDGVGFYNVQITNNVNYSLTGTINWTSGTYSNIYTCSVDNYDYFLTCYTSSTSFRITIILIDLTQMFGSGNEPNLQQCQDLFISDYYGYNSGSAISLNSLDSYGQGYNDALGQFKWTITNSSFLSSAQSVDITGYKGNVNASGGSLGVSSVSNSTYTTCYIPFNFVIPVGSQVKFGGRATISSTDHNTRTLYLAYYSNGQMVNIVSQSVSAGTFNPMNLSFVAPVDMYGCYIYLSDAELDFTLYMAEFSMMIPDVYGAVQTSYNSGWQNAKTYFESYYSENGQGYHDIWQAGYIYGLNEDTPYTFGNLMTSVVEAPVNAVLGMFNFDFLGYNFKNVITLIITLCVILSIIRLFIGMGASE